MAEKTDWVKLIAIVLAIVFFFLWTSTKNEYVENYNSLYKQCNSSIHTSNSDLNSSVQIMTTFCKTSLQNLQSQWELSFQNLLNCYEQGTSQCKYTTPTLNLTG